MPLSINSVGTQPFIEFWAGPTVEAFVEETVVYRSVEKVFFTGATCSISNEASFIGAAAEHCRTRDRTSLGGADR